MTTPASIRPGPGCPDHHGAWIHGQPITADCALECLWFPLSRRAYGALQRGLPGLLGHPASVGDVASLHRQRRLSQIRHLGPRRIGEIELLLVVHGFNIAPSDQPP